MNINVTQNKLIYGQNLTMAESESLFLGIFRQKLADHETKAVLLLLAQKGETADELTGCVNALRKLEPPISGAKSNALDTCGTGGDGSQSLNISTLAAFIIAGAGAKVAKHGNRSISSRCGSSDLMRELGVNLEASPAKMKTAVQKAGIGYFHAPYFHPVFARMQPLRQRLKVRTIFNLLGPLVNPMGVERQIVGVAKDRYFRLYAKVLKNQKVKKALVCHSTDGMDEISTRSRSELAWVTRSGIRYETLDPRKLGIRPPSRRALQGGTAKQNARESLEILRGVLKGPKRDIVTLNAAAGLMVADLASNFKQGCRMASHSIDSGKAYASLTQLRKISHSK